MKRDGWVYELALSPDGRYVATSTGKPELLGGKQGETVVTVWEWQSGREIGHIKSDRAMTALAFSKNGQFLAAGGLDGIAHIMRVKDGQEAKQLQGDSPIKALAFSPDNSFMAIASGGSVGDERPILQGTTTLWRIDGDSKKVLVKEEHSSWVTAVAYSNHGKYWASIDQNGLVGIWTTGSGHKIATIHHDGYEAEARVHFSPDDRYLITAFGNKAHVWEISTGKEVARREHPFGYLWDAAFSPTGKYIATAGTDTTSNLWLWRPEDLIKEACSRLPSNLTESDWRQYIGSDLPYHATCAKLNQAKD